jgi:FAD/FMN-containing dehydrogenase
MSKHLDYTSWGRLPGAPHHGCRLASRAGSLPLLAGERALPFGNGRSYGDSCHSDGVLLDTRSLTAIIAFDRATGVLTCEPGLLLSDLFRVIIPAGWFVPVTPGTQFITIGGAIANDVHGKNHHDQGTFGRHVRRFELLRSDGTRRICTSADHADMFAATIGGLGLTGLITWAEIQLIRIKSSQIDQEIIPFGRLDEFTDLAVQSDRTHDYSVAWIDSLAAGPALGRGLFIRGNHAEAPGPLQPRPGAARIGVPLTPPVPLINRLTLSAFNALYWRQTGGRIKQQRIDYTPFFYPLDAIRGWNRLYGPGGLMQHQCVVPLADGMAVVRDLIVRTQRARIGSFLTVLKVFGDRPSPGLLSFPMPGLTLTLDFANSGPAVLQLLDELDTATIAAGGRVNPYKDARMTPATFAASFPHHSKLTPFIDPAFSSRFWTRVTAGR